MIIIIPSCIEWLWKVSLLSLSRLSMVKSLYLSYLYRLHRICNGFFANYIALHCHYINLHYSSPEQLQTGTYCKAFSRFWTRIISQIYFISNFSFALYFLAIYSQATCRPAASCATLLGVVFQVSEWKLCSQQIRIGLCHLCAMFLCFCALSADKRGKYFSGHRLTFDPLRSGAGVLTRGLDDLSCPGVLVGIQPLKLHSSE